MNDIIYDDKASAKAACEEYVRAMYDLQSKLAAGQKQAAISRECYIPTSTMRKQQRHLSRTKQVLPPAAKETIMSKKLRSKTPVAAASPCSAGWLPPETAPKNETCIIANFGWPWPVIAIWCLVQEEWAIAQLAPCSEDDGRGWETEWEKGSSLIGWMPLPSLPNPEDIPHAVSESSDCSKSE